MPIFKAAGQLVYFAHVPKCGGTSVEAYLAQRFGQLGLHDPTFSFVKRMPAEHRWTRSSPQHVDLQSLDRIVPPDFFDAIFAVVRHPVARAVSTYHHHLEFSRKIPPGTSFSDWLAELETGPTAPFAYDNHALPMTQIVPLGATVFHLEHGLDAIVPWLDLLTGEAAAPRAIRAENTRGTRADHGKVVPSESDLQRIARLYDADFQRFGYSLGDRMPKAPAPEISAAYLAERARALRAARHPLARLRRRAWRSLQRRL